MQPLERRRGLQQHLSEVMEAENMVKWCLKLAELVLGKHYLFEAALGGWSL